MSSLAIARIGHGQGTQLPDLKAARTEAVRLASALLNEKAAEFWNSRELTMRVTDDADLTLFQLTFFATDGAAIG